MYLKNVYIEVCETRTRRKRALCSHLTPFKILFKIEQRVVLTVYKRPT